MSLTKLRNSLPVLNGESLDFIFDHRLDDVFELDQMAVVPPPLALQQKFAAIVESIECQKTTQRAHRTDEETVAQIRGTSFTSYIRSCS